MVPIVVFVNAFGYLLSEILEAEFEFVTVKLWGQALGPGPYALLDFRLTFRL
jgi:hypothetical protein